MTVLLNFVGVYNLIGGLGDEVPQKQKLFRLSCTKPSKIQEFQNHSFSETGAGTKDFINFVAPNKVEVKF